MHNPIVDGFGLILFLLLIVTFGAMFFDMGRQLIRRWKKNGTRV